MFKAWKVIQGILKRICLQKVKALHKLARFNDVQAKRTIINQPCLWINRNKVSTLELFEFRVTFDLNMIQC